MSKLAIAVFVAVVILVVILLKYKDIRAYFGIPDASGANIQYKVVDVVDESGKSYNGEHVIYHWNGQCSGILSVPFDPVDVCNIKMHVDANPQSVENAPPLKVYSTSGLALETVAGDPGYAYQIWTK